MLVRTAEPRDRAAIVAIIMPTIAAGETYALDPAMSDADAVACWTAPDKETFVAEDDGMVLGTFYLRANQAGGGQHVCNCGYMTDTAATGRGVARRMCEYSIELARARGYRAMQFNFVVSTNARAVKLWTSLGFAIVGQIPEAFRLPSGQYVERGIRRWRWRTRHSCATDSRPTMRGRKGCGSSPSRSMCLTSSSTAGMPAKNMSISLGDHMLGFAQQQVATGRYSSTSDVVRAGLRLLEEHEARVQALREAAEAHRRRGPPRLRAGEARLKPGEPPCRLSPSRVQ
jgi:putative addiction module CopG family antidote